MTSISIKARLALLVGFMAVLMLAGGGVGISGIASTNQALESTYRDRLEPAVAIAQIMLLMQENRAQVMLGIQHDPGNPLAKLHDHRLALHVDNFARNRDAITAAWEDYIARKLPAQEQALADKFAAARGRYVGEGLAPAIEALKAEQYGKANEILLTRINPLHAEVNAVADELFKMSTVGARADYEASMAQYAKLRALGIGGTLAGIVLAALAGWLLIRSISGPLERVIASFERIAAGRLDDTVSVDRDDEMGRCLTALAAMQKQLRETIGEIGRAAGSIERQSVQLQADMEQVAARSNSQLDRVQEVAAAMEEVSQSVAEVAANAEGTAGAAVDSQGIVRNSHRQMTDSMDATGRVVEAVESASATIRELSNAIRRIDQITQVIKEIADQVLAAMAGIAIVGFATRRRK